MLAPRPVSHMGSECVVPAFPRASQNGGVQIAVVVHDAESRSGRCDHRARQNEKRRSKQSLPAPNDRTRRCRDEKSPSKRRNMRLSSELGCLKSVAARNLPQPQATHDVRRGTQYDDFTLANAK